MEREREKPCLLAFEAWRSITQHRTNKHPQSKSRGERSLKTEQRSQKCNREHHQVRTAFKIIKKRQKKEKELAIFFWVIQKK